MNRFLHSLNIAAQCREWRVPLWSCPQVLFIVMGVVIITAMVGINMAARRYAEPEIAAMVVLFVTAFLFVIGYIITKSFERVAQVSRAKAEFMSIMSHQLRTPLTNIRWRLERISGEEAVFLRQENEDMLRMVNMMLEVNRIEENALVLEKQALPLRDLARRVRDAFRARAEKKQIALAFVCDEEDALITRGDPVRLRWVLENFVDNALRYGPEESAVTITLERKGTMAYVSVRNEGPGIAKDEQKKLFTKFFRGTDEHTRLTTEGFGLGLYVAKAIVEAHEGTIGVASPVEHKPLTFSDEKLRGKGSIFWFTLPLGT